MSTLSTTATPVKFQSLSKDSTANTNVVLEWRDLSFSVIQKDAKQSKPFRPVNFQKQILHHVSGNAKSGELLAIMGPTGCGKTSLLNILAARVPNGSAAVSSISGQIFVNGHIRNDEEFRSQSAYVLQDDRLYAHLTVFETLLLAAHFFLPDSATLDEKTNLVNEVISELGLIKAKNTIIGNEKVRGVSGGERKRANIAVQLITNPLILFLDEPTSGLDAFQAQAVMESMKIMASHGRVIISVIHQPRSSIYDMFDKLLLLSEGHAIYLGAAHEATLYFASNGFSCPDLFNPSDYFLDILSPDHRSVDAEEEASKRIQNLALCWEKKMTNEPPTIQIIDSTPLVAHHHPFTLERLVRNWKILAWRSFAEQSREIPTFLIKVFMTCFFALIIGGIYSNIGYSQKSIQNRKGLLFVICINQAFNNVTVVLNVFPKEKIIVNRERSMGAYDTLSYFMAKYLVELPINLIPSIIYSCIVYWIVGLNKHRFGYFLLIVIFETATAIPLGLAVSALTPTVDAANALGPVTVIVALLFGGFYININSLPIVANWIPYLSFLKWTYEALCINEFKGETFVCDSSPSVACIQTGEEVLSGLSFGGVSTAHACFGLGMILLGFVCAAIFFLERSKLSFLSIGHMGAQHKAFGASQA